MTALGVTPNTNTTFSTGERVVRPSKVSAPDLLAAHDFYTWQDSSGNGHDLIRGSAVLLDDAGGLQLRSGTQAFAIIDGLPPPSQFSIVLTGLARDTAGTLFGNYNGADEGLRIYTSSTQLFARVGNTTGQIVLTMPTLNVPFDFAFSYNAGAMVLCTETLTVSGNDASPLGTSFLRYGASALSTPTASNTLFAGGYVCAGARNTADLRLLIAAARAKRLGENFGL